MCESGACVLGRCAPVAVADTESATFEIDAAYVYFQSGGGLCSRGKATVTGAPSCPGGANFQANIKMVAAPTRLFVYGSTTTQYAFDLPSLATRGYVSGATVMQTVASDADSLYSYTSTGKVLACLGPTGCSGEGTTLLTGYTSLGGIALDGHDLYLADVASGEIVRADVRGTPVTPVSFVTGQGSPGRPACDDTHVYWPLLSGAILRRAKSGGATELLASDVAGPVLVVVSGDFVYWTNPAAGSVNRVRKTGGSVLPLALARTSPTDLHVDGTHVYWSDQSIDSHLAHGSVARITVIPASPTSWVTPKPYFLGNSQALLLG